MPINANSVVYRIEKELPRYDLANRVTLRDLRRMVAGLNKIVRKDLIKNVAKLQRPALLQIIKGNYLVGEGLSSKRPNSLSLYEDDEDAEDGPYPQVLTIDETDYMKKIRKGRAPKAKAKAKAKPKAKGKPAKKKA